MIHPLFTINIDYHATPLGLAQQDISLVHGMGFSLDSIVRYMYDLYLMGFLQSYGSKQDVLVELSTYNDFFKLTDNGYELDTLREYLYGNKLNEMEQSLNMVTDLDSYGKLKSKVDYVKQLILNKGKYMDTLCNVFLKLNNYILTHAQYYISPINDFSAKTGLHNQFIKTGAINICGGWIVVEFVQVQ